MQAGHLTFGSSISAFETLQAAGEISLIRFEGKEGRSYDAVGDEKAGEDSVRVEDGEDGVHEA